MIALEGMLFFSCCCSCCVDPTLPGIRCGSHAFPMWQSVGQPHKKHMRALRARAPKRAGFACAAHANPMCCRRKNRSAGRRLRTWMRNACALDASNQRVRGTDAAQLRFMCGKAADRVRPMCGKFVDDSMRSGSVPDAVRFGPGCGFVAHKLRFECG